MAASTVSEHLCLVIGDHATAKASGRIEGSRQRTHAAAMRRRDNRHGGGCLAARTCMSRPRPLPADLPDASRRRPRGRNRLRPRESSRLLPHERLDASPRVASWRRAPSPSTCASRLSITRPRKRPAGSRGVACARRPQSRADATTATASARTPQPCADATTATAAAASRREPACLAPGLSPRTCRTLRVGVHAVEIVSDHESPLACCPTRGSMPRPESRHGGEHRLRAPVPRDSRSPDRESVRQDRGESPAHAGRSHAQTRQPPPPAHARRSHAQTRQPPRRRLPRGANLQVSPPASPRGPAGRFA
jgi:hypothetical protein